MARPTLRRRRVGEVEEFLAATVPQLEEADTALHSGNPGLRSAMWSHQDPVTLFGAAITRVGWAEIGPTFEWLASNFSNCESFEYEVVAAGVSGDLAYIVGIEHTTASVGGAVRPLLAAGHDHPPTRGWRVEGSPPAWRPGSGQRLRW
jgi:hypothetical protein